MADLDQRGAIAQQYWMGPSVGWVTGYKAYLDLPTVGTTNVALGTTLVRVNETLTVAFMLGADGSDLTAADGTFLIVTS